MRRRLLLINARANLIRGLSSALLNLVLPLVLLRLFTATEFAVWILVFGVSAYALYLDLGLTVTVSSLVAQADAAGNQRMGTSYVAAAIRLLSGVALLLLSVYVFLGVNLRSLFPHVPEGLRIDGSWALVMLGAAQIAVLYGNVFVGYFTGLQRAQVPAAVISVGKLIAFLATVLAAAVGANIAITAFVYLVATLVSIGALAFAYFRHTRGSFLRHVERDAVTALVSLGAILGTLSLCMLFVSGVDTAVVGRLAYRELPPFGVATVIGAVTVGTFGATMAPLLPEFSRMIHENRAKRVVEVLRETSRLATTWFLLVVIGFMFLGRPIVDAVAGRGVGNAAYSLTLLLVTAAATRASVTPLSMAVIAMKGRRSVLLISGITEALVNLVTSIVLCQHMGAAGVAIGTIVGAWMGIGVMLVIVVPMYPELRTQRLSIIWHTWGAPVLATLPGMAAGFVVYFRASPAWFVAVCVAAGSSLTLFLCRDQLRRVSSLRTIGRSVPA